MNSHRLAYDIHQPQAGPPRGLIVTSRDAYGGDTITTWDDYGLLPVTSTSPAGLTTHTEYDYRLYKPHIITDPNGDQTVTRYTPLGLTASIARCDSAGTTGDTDDQPGQIFDYDLTGYDDAQTTGQPPRPMRITTIRRCRHRWDMVNEENDRRRQTGQPQMSDPDVAAMFPAEEPSRFPDRFVITADYSDGLGRHLQTRTRVGPDHASSVALPLDGSPAGRTIAMDPPTSEDPVTVTGHIEYDVKGRPVRTFEATRSAGLGYAGPDPSTLAPAVTTYHDALGRVIATTTPDGRQHRVIHGRPATLTDLGQVIPTPWETFTYDHSDNGARSHPTSSLDASDAWDTPVSATVDAFGRAITTTEHRPGGNETTTRRYDIDGHLLSATDQLGRTVTAFSYDRIGRPWRTWLLDAGATVTVLTPLSGPVEHRDDKGALTLNGYDQAHRQVLTWNADRARQQPTLRCVTVYGDDTTASGYDATTAAARRCLGRVVTAYDEAGRLTVDGYDLNGHQRTVRRQLLRTSLLTAALPAEGTGQWSATSYTTDWQTLAGQTLLEHAEQLLDPTEYRTDNTYDALGRRTRTTGPLDVTDARAITDYTYDPGGAIHSVHVDGAPYVDRVVYDAHGRRRLLHLGNDVLLRYEYEPDTFQLRRTRADHVITQGQGWACDGPALLDRTYRYDLAGDVVTTRDQHPGCGLPLTGLDQLDRLFGYDDLHQLIRATGRETNQAPGSPWADQPRGLDLSSARPYTETYTYDAVGALTHLAHLTTDPATPGYSRDFDSSPDSNQTTALRGTTPVIPYTYDDCGNMTSEASNRHFEWDHANRLASFRDQAGPALPTVYTQHRYDTHGHRVFTFVRRSSGLDEVSIYLDGFERTIQLQGGKAAGCWDELHLTDGPARLASINRGPAHPDDPMPEHPVRYLFNDHLGSVSATLAADGQVLNREDYNPHGQTTFGSYQRKRYRHTGGHHDHHTGLILHGARYYAPWLGRWISPDPAGQIDSSNLYQYARNNPMGYVDPTGHASTRQLISRNAEYRTAWETALTKVMGTETYAEAALKYEKILQEAKAVGGMGSNTKKGTMIYTARSIYSRTRTEFGKLVDITGLHVHHKFGGLAKNPLIGVDPSHLIVLDPTSHRRAHAVERALQKAGNSIRGAIDRLKGAAGSAKTSAGASAKAGFTTLGAMAHTLQIFSVITAIPSALAIRGDVRSKDYAAAAGHGMEAAGGALEGVSLVAGAIGSAKLSALAGGVSRVTGFVGLAATVGWYTGRTIDSHLSPATQNAIGGTINQIVNEGGWREIYRHPFGIGM